MAYVNQERKAKIAANLKKVMPEGWKYSLAVRNHSTLVLTIRQAPVDLLGNIRETTSKMDYAFAYGNKAPEVGTYWDVNTYYIDRQFSGDVLATMQAIDVAMNDGNHDNSDIQTDYFDVGWYVDIKIGKWDDPFLDTIPRPATKSPAVWTKSPAAPKPAKAELAQYLPDDWASLSPGRKAAATKKAMQLAAANA